MVVPLIATPARLPPVHPLAVRIVDSGAPFRVGRAQHARRRRKKFVRGEERNRPQPRIGHIDVAPDEISVLA